MLLAALSGAEAWLHAHPQHDPRAPLTLDQPAGWATQSKLAALKSDPAQCRVFLERSELRFDALEPAGSGECYRDDRIVFDESDRLPGLSPGGAAATCATQAALARWQRHVVQPEARRLLGASVARIEHFGTYSCRRIGGGETGRWSQHARGNAIDISGFVLDDGTRISVRQDWTDNDAGSAFLKAVRDGACGEFTVVLSPDYNAAHADHLHFDQSPGGFGLCR